LLEGAAMLLEDYFDFDANDRIRFKGSRLGIEFVIERFLQGESPAMILHNYHHAVNLEQIYASITYYLHNKAALDDSMAKNKAIAEAEYQEYLKQEPPSVIKRLKAMRAEREKVGS
jgi:uncharacterized protein (DUF433 family)